jgi:hypothetical protein
LSSEVACSSTELFENDDETAKLADSYLDMLAKLKETYKAQISYDDKVSGMFSMHV